MPALSREKAYWFDYPDDPLGGKIKVRYLNEGEKAELKEKTSPTQARLNDKKVEVSMDMNAARTREETAVAYIIDWDNFLDGKKVKGKPNGAVLPCTNNNKKKFSREDGFMGFLYECIEAVEKKVKKENEEEEKNSETSQDG